ncbi:hypothetical protein AEST_29760 [Alishewanella aestuarii B11]|uniref:Uncharacterized protein n=1 Tax=Alishewanella aestuarii B11 TaxID=1197174 RepID=J2IAL2_9ALTE|nr:hypothetical protein AEST_29760 [Alishewanella aestuarii B11]
MSFIKFTEILSKLHERPDKVLTLPLLRQELFQSVSELY